MQVLTPSKDIAFPLKRWEYISHRLLRKGEPFLVDQNIAPLFEHMRRNGMDPGPITEVEDHCYHYTTDVRKVLLLFPGYLSEVVQIKAGLERMKPSFPNLEHIAFASSTTDAQVLDGSYEYDLAVIDFPVSLRLAESYDTWISFTPDARRESVIPMCAIGEENNHAHLRVHEGSLAAVSTFIQPTGNRRAGIRIYSDEHYRSWYPEHAYVTMLGLAEQGFDCYIIGEPSQRVRFKGEDGEEILLWGEGIYDTCGLLTSIGEVIAFASMMDVIVAPDSDLLHIAGCLEVPTVGLFGLSDGVARTQQYPTVRVMQGDLECCPCNAVGTPECSAPWCDAIAKIHPERIIEEVCDVCR